MSRPLKVDKTKLSGLRRRLRNARARAAYWSGRPSFTGAGYTPSRTHRSADHEYELAMCDIASLCKAIEALTGVQPKIVDTRQVWKEAAAKLMRGVRDGRARLSEKEDRDS